MIFGGPERFAVSVWPIFSWNVAGNHRNGILYYIRAGKYFLKI
jgi:hypothetical protein